MQDYKQDFLNLSLESGALAFGEFTLKSGRVSPYFFNAGQFHTGALLAGLARCYASALLDSGIAFDMLFGPAYKGIPLAAATALALAERGKNVPYSFDRKEVKDHGEGGKIVGAPLSGRVVIVDDVITAGTAVGEATETIHAAGATPVAVAISLDRQERGQGNESAAREVERRENLHVIPVASLDDLIDWLGQHGEYQNHFDRIRGYRSEWGSS